MSADSLRPGDRVRVEILRSRPNCLAVSPVTVDIRTGVYLGVPRFEATIAQVRLLDGSIRRFPLEYLSGY